MGTLDAIFVYPIKAMPGVQVDAVTITQGGALFNDRRWAIKDEQGRLINGKNNKRIFSLQASFDLTSEVVSFPSDKGDEMFKLADRVGLSNYFSEKLGKKVFLEEDSQQGFPDDMNASGPTIISKESLNAVLSWYPTLFIEDIRARFRINLEVSSVPAFWEDQLFEANEEPKIIQVGDVKIQSSNPCARCSVPTKDPKSGKPHSDFYETFIKQREQTRPSWTDDRCFDHWYRLSVNTNIYSTQVGMRIAVGDKVSIVGL